MGDSYHQIEYFKMVTERDWEQFKDTGGVTSLDVIYRTVKSRGIVFSKGEMEGYGIERIMNIVSDYRLLHRGDVYQMERNYSSGGRYAVSESVSDGRFVTVSIIIFRDEGSYRMFIVKKWDDWGKKGMMGSAGHLFN